MLNIAHLAPEPQISTPKQTLKPAGVVALVVFLKLSMRKTNATIAFSSRKDHFGVAVDDLFRPLDHSAFVCHSTTTVLPSYATDVAELSLAAASGGNMVSRDVSSENSWWNLLSVHQK
ncbi:hypothetical protein CB0940_12273 [Cercospora beticola]|uniref:Uncharacterized protein n=1 Tax=Cercospora beticola TaxID=122368 RepID=A0A2G5GQ88_CERBT|nr:hypothetical protein CB0940_12273 [Cercospora beticola]PIA82445.1 hypothetical protein CB0940_12273 [Cercospora beticola]WPB07047.1 hypothetical protein RHO25_011707 [Cercospora beticola]